jgi:autotransporter-associated beta strand protein
MLRGINVSIPRSSIARSTVFPNRHSFARVFALFWCAAAGGVLLSGPLAAGDGTWSADADGGWGQPANWVNGAVADGAGYAAIFNQGTSAPRAVAVDGQRTIGRMVFDSPFGWTVAGGTLILAGADPGVEAVSDVVVGATLAGAGGLRKAGAGKLTLAGPAVYSGLTVVEAGTLRLEFAPLAGAPPLGYWRMDEGSGTLLANLVAGAPGGTLINNPAWVEGPGGPGTWAVQFNGTNQFGNIEPNAALHAVGGGALSVSAWVKTSLPGDFFRSLVSKYGNTSTTPFWGLGWSNPNALGFVGRNSSGTRNQAHTGAAALDNVWHHLVGVRESDNTMRIYLDGVLHASVAGPTGSMANARPIQICRHLNTYVPAAVARVGVWDRALSVAEVASLYQSGWSPGHQITAGPLLVGAAGTLELGIPRAVASLGDHLGAGGTVALGAHDLGVGGDGSSTTFSGEIAGSGGLVKTGAGTFTLAGVNTYSGRTTVEAGVLALSGALSSSTRLAVRSGASFELAAAGTLRFRAESFANANTLDGAGAATFAGTFEIDRSQAQALPGSAWKLVDMASLSAVSYAGSFQVAGFAVDPLASGVWVREENGRRWTFNQATGTLTAPPVVTLPVVENRPAVVFDTVSASLRGAVVASGGEIPAVTLFHGAGDGGTDPVAWDQAVELGPQPGAFSAFVAGLAPGSTRYYRARASNGAGPAWAPNSAVLVLPASLAPQVHINEFMASNNSALADEDGDFSDWIELVNPGGSAIDLTGWGLSDDPANPFKWVFPPGAGIPAGGYLLVWASGKNRVDPAAPLHTSFNIAASGEILTLTRPDASLADQTEAIVAQRDVSRGRRADDPTTWAFFAEATPGAANTTAPEPERLPAVVFSHPGGLHSAGFQLALAHPDPDALIVFTLDGSEPDLANLGGSTYQFRNSYNNGPLLSQGFTSLPYTVPIAIADRSTQPNKISLVSSTSDSNPGYLPAAPVKKATVVRAKAYAGGLESPVANASYFVSAGGAFAYDLPLVSLTFDEDSFFDYNDGIYVAGVDHVTATGGRICNWGNFNRQGFESERAGHLQFFENGALAVDQGVGLRVHGNCSRRNAFKSLRLYADRRYDANNEFDHPFFAEAVPDASDPGNTLFRRLILRSPSINEVAFNRLYQPVSGAVGGRLRPVVKFLNGEYWGVSYLRDRLDEHHVARHYELDSDNVVMVNIKYGHEIGSSELRVFDISAGLPADMDDFWAMRGFIIGNNMSDPELYAQARGILDMQTFIDHLVFKIFAGDDHYAPEYIFWKTRVPENAGHGDGRWRLMVKDFDSTLFTANYVTGLATGTHPRPFGYELFQSLLANPDFRNDFINRFADLLNAQFRPERFQAIIHAAYDEMAPYWGEMSARWNNIAFSNPSKPFTPAGRDALLNWATTHPPRQRLHLRQHFGLAGETDLTVDVSDPGHGSVRVNTIDIAGSTPGLAAQPYPWTGVYFHNVPVILQARPAPGYRFSGWRLNGGPGYHSIAKTLTLSFAAATTVVAEFQPAAPIHRWDFESAAQFLQPSYTVGGGGFAATPGPATEVLRNTASQGFDSAHLRVNNPLGSSIVFNLPTSGFEEISLAFRTRRSGQGAGLQTLAYTLDGVAWTDFETYVVGDADPQAKTFDFTGLAAAGDNPQFAVRISFAQGDGGTAGNNRFDDVTLAGLALPGSNLPPFATGALPPRLDLVEGAPASTFDPAGWFFDPEGAPLAITATSSLPALAGAAIEGGQLVLAGLQRGESLLALTAADGVNAPAAASVRLLVHPAPLDLAAGPLAFGAWDPATPERVYPPHLLFVQGAENDSSLATELDRAYFIPHDDYAEGDSPGFPYNPTQRTRLNGLGGDGLAFINTGRGRDLGGVLAALDTSGVAAARVGFTAGTLVPNERVCAIRLQWRAGVAGPFADVPDGSGQPVEYVRDPAAGHQSIVGPIDLPPALLGQPYIQLLWRYYRVGGESGARAQLRLDDLLVSADPASAPATMVFDPAPAGAQSGGPLGPVAVRLFDAAGFPATGFNGPVGISLAGGGALSGTLTVHAVNGIATFADLVLAGTGEHQLVASAAGLEPLAGAPFRSLGLTALLVPQFIQGGVDEELENNQRVPCAWRARIDGLAPGATYRFANRAVLAGDGPASDGAGNMIFVTSAGENWLRATQSPRFEPGDLGSRHFTFTAGPDGSFGGWFVTEPTGNTRFTPGNALHFRLLLNDGAGGTAAANILTTTEAATVLRFGEGLGEGSAVTGQAATAARRMVVLFGDAAGGGMPLAATPVEITGAGTDERYAPFYRDEVAVNQSRWGTILPNNLPAGLQRFEILPPDGAGGALDIRIEPEGFPNTVNASSGLAPVTIDADAGLPVFLPGGAAPWHNPANWSTGITPGGPGATAIFNAPAVAGRDVSLTAPVTIGTLRFNQAGSGFRNRLRGSGAGTLAFDGGGKPAVLRVDGDGDGPVEIDLDAPVVLADDLILLVNHTGNSTDDAPGALRLQQSWTGPGGLVKQGPGMASLTGEGKTFTGAVVVEQGVLRVTAPAVPAAAAGLGVLPGGQLRLVSSGTWAEPAVHVFGGGALSLAGPGRGGDLPPGQELGVLGALRYDPGGSGKAASLANPVALAAASDIHVDGAGNLLRLDGPLTGAAFELAKTGGGTLELAGANGPGAPPVSVQTGVLAVTGSHPAAVTVGIGTTLTGSGSTGPVGGAGAVAVAANLAAPSSAVARVAATLAVPGGPAGNGALVLDGPAPLPQPPQQLDLFLAAPQRLPGDRFAGGLVVPAAFDLAAALSGTAVNLFVADPAGPVGHLGQMFRAAEEADFLSWSVVGLPAGRTLEVLQGGNPTGYEQWRGLVFTDPTERADDAIAGPAASAANDGFANLLRYALGTGPRDPVAALLPRIGPAAPAGFAFRFRFDPAKADLAWIVRRSPDLADWSGVLFDSRTDTPPAPDPEGWTNLPVPGESALFLRLELLRAGP